MGMYTMLDMTLRLKRDTPASVVDTLSRLVTRDSGDTVMSDEERGSILPDAPSRVLWMFHSSSAYLEDEYKARRSFDQESLVLDVGFDIKNYEREIQWLLNWLSPYAEEVIRGWYMYEEDAQKSAVVLRDGVLVIGVTTQREDDWYWW